MSIKRCYQEIDEIELNEWMQYDRLDPFGSKRSDYEKASVMTMIGAVNGSSRNIGDYLTDFTPQEPIKQDSDYIVKQLNQFRNINNKVKGENLQQGPMGRF